MKNPLIFNIQKFSVHDGPGIRTTIFFKGCPIRCLWCHNPESQSYQLEDMENKEGAVKTVGSEYSIRDLVKAVEKDQLFYDQSGGGVTLSGGESMTQDMEYIEKLVKEFHRKGISVAIDTCGVVPSENYAKVLPYTDIFLYDLKFIDSDKHKKYTGVGNELVLSNLKMLSDAGAKLNLRLIMLDGVNTEKEDLDEMINWLKRENIKIDSINLLPYHEYGKDKYRRLKREYLDKDLHRPSDETLNRVKKRFESDNFRVVIGGAEINKVS